MTEIPRFRYKAYPPLGAFGSAPYATTVPTIPMMHTRTATNATGVRTIPMMRARTARTIERADRRAVA